ncbi:MAG: hypothetical protein V4613_01230 [Bacteroidota bacterium]
MKNIVLLLTTVFSLTAFTSPNSKPIPCGKFQGHNIYKGEKGGCFYLKTKKKIKVYIDKKHCKC